MQPPDNKSIEPSLGRLGLDSPTCDLAFLYKNGRRMTQAALPVKGDRGFTLAEIAVALGIFSFALVSMLGMLSVGLKNTRKATIQTSASNVMAGIVSDIKASKISIATSSGSDTLTFLSPKLGISADLDKKTSTVSSGSISPRMPLYISESCSLVSTSSPEILQKVYSVDITAGAIGVPAVRVRLEWPAIRPSNSRPEGFLETLVPLPF